MSVQPHWAVRGERGQTLAEYGLILSLIAVVAVAALILLGTDLSNILSTLGSKL
jgi:pilus assembly protein Flp/PilA